jgi:DNA-binding NarL/FixJ family response regulator
MLRTVLIVDDHAGYRGGARALLESDGLEVVGEAADGESAIEAAHRLRPDVVLLDVQLPARTVSRWPSASPRRATLPQSC